MMKFRKRIFAALLASSSVPRCASSPPPAPRPPAASAPIPTSDAGTSAAAAGARPARSEVITEARNAALSARPPIPDWPRFLALASAPRPAAGTEHYGEVDRVYRMAAPATVMVRAGRGYGSGVVVSAQGDVLTNHHVIAGAEMVDLARKVRVQRGHLGPDGVMVLDPELIEGWVTATAPGVDLAVIRLATVPPGLAHVDLAPQAPTPGTTVASLGNGSVGLMWTIRSCDIQAIGRPAENAAFRQAFCQTDSQSPHCRDRTALLADYPNTVIQTGCALSGGDSGGPLLNTAGQLVGLNSSTDRFAPRVDPSDLQRVNMHVHLDDVRAIVQRASERREIVARPWVRPLDIVRRDQDRDGHYDTVHVTDGEGYSVSGYDVDQNSLDGSLEEIRRRLMEGNLDLEAAELNQSRSSTAIGYNDTDDDGRFDFVAVRSPEGLTAYTVDANGAPQRVDDLAEGHGLRPEERFSGALRTLFNQRYAAVSERTEPNPIPAETADEGTVRDEDRDGQGDTVQLRVDGLLAFLYDTDQSSLGGEPSEAQARLRHLELDAEVAQQSLNGTNRVNWTWYDRDNDGVFDLAFRGGHSSLFVGVVDQAFARDARGQNTPLPGFAGRLTLRPDLLSAGGERFHSIFRQAGFVGDPANWSIDGLPHPLTHSSLPEVSRSDLRRSLADATLIVSGQLFSSLVIDVDRDSFRGDRRSHRGLAAAEIHARGLFDGELALVLLGQNVWVWYDRDNDGTWDHVTVQYLTSSYRPARACLSRNANGRFETDSAACEGPLVNPERFAAATLRRGFSAFRSLFRAEWL